MNIISMRLGRMGCNKAVGAVELLTLNDGLELCTPDDRRKIEEEQRAQRQGEEEFHQLMMDLRLARQQAAPARRAPHVKHIDMPDALLQSEVRNFCPPGTKIWKNNTHVGWHGHCPPFRRMSATVATTGSEKAAASKVLKTLWLQYCHAHGCSLADACFVRGLFTDAELADARPAGEEPSAPLATQAPAPVAPSSRGRARGSRGGGRGSSSSAAGAASSSAASAPRLCATAGGRGRGAKGPVWDGA